MRARRDVTDEVRREELVRALEAARAVEAELQAPAGRAGPTPAAGEPETYLPGGWPDPYADDPELHAAPWGPRGQLLRRIVRRLIGVTR